MKSLTVLTFDASKSKVFYFVSLYLYKTRMRIKKFGTTKCVCVTDMSGYWTGHSNLMIKSIVLWSIFVTILSFCNQMRIARVKQN